MKIAVYTIVKNAAPYIQYWIESARDADYLILGDTGSTDRTVAIARKYGATVYKIQPETPFHFGNARNAILAKVPADTDVCVVLDADETLGDGWREAVEREWNGSLMTVQYYNGPHSSRIARIHPRNAQWRDRIHEYIYLEGSTLGDSSVQLYHNQDKNRDRSWYIDLLNQQIADGESVSRSLAMLGKEYAVRGLKAQAIDAFERYLQEDTDYMQERASVCNMLYYLTQDPLWLYKSIWYCPPQQEAYQRLAAYMLHNSDYVGAYHYARMSLEYEPLEVFTEYLLTDEAIHAILAESAYQTGRHTEATATAGWLVENYPASGHQNNLSRYQGG